MGHGCTLDLCSMSEDDTKLLNEIYMRYSKNYTEMIDALSRRWKENPYWWSTHLASRNPLLSTAYQDICIVLLALRRIKTDKQIKKVILPNKAVSDVLDKYYRGKARSIKFSYQHDDMDKNSFENFITLLLKGVEQKKIVDKIMLSSAAIARNEKIVLIDTEILASHVKKDNYQDRLFKNIQDYTDKKIVFLPALVDDINIRYEYLVEKVYQNRKHNTVLKEQFLKKMDYLKVLFLPIWIALFCMGRKVFKGIDVTEILNRDIRMALSSKNAQESILKYFLMKRMKKSGVNIETLVGWYEGQPSSLGMYMAYHRLYKHGKSIGAIGYASDKCWMSLAPSKEQMRQRVAPQQIGVAGNAFSNISKQFCQGVKTILFPAFRLQEALGYSRLYDKKSSKNILFALSYDINISKKILVCIKHIENWISVQNIKIYIKNHPLLSKKRLCDYGITELNCNYEFIDGSFQDALDCASIVVTTKSTSTYEAVLAGKRVIVVAIRNEILYTYMPLKWEGTFYDIAYNENELKDIIGRFLQMESVELELDETYLVKASADALNKIL